MSIRRSRGQKKQTRCNAYDFQKFFHGFHASLFQNQTETVRAHTVNWIFQRILQYVRKTKFQVS
ncbi:hypothetical protein LEP1GSC161_3506 [Leptospira santarosai str. CBC1416]|uniref:Uncharacterized protein n=1 Tax=Leptospira santarosai str. CBC1416 TaxID=1193059 RepID=M6WBA0_9LEPT|nr:hypothetical protein LEP1GSC161_3506 [Leptospira santarosai str. CBC1416]EPG82693.1 hypothetical protein LEP1GSC048_3801 [Leptospira santarosai serovar Shermani str. 1342KT]